LQFSAAVLYFKGKIATKWLETDQDNLRT